MDRITMMPIWVLAFNDGNGLAGDDRLPNYILAYTEKQLAEYGRRMCRRKKLVRVTFMPLPVLQELVAKSPAIEGVGLVFGMGPVVPWKGGRAREIQKAYIKRTAFLSINESEAVCDESRQ